MVPGPKFSMKTSPSSISLRSSALPPSSLRLQVTLRLLALSSMK